MMIQRVNTTGTGADPSSRPERAGKFPMVASRFPVFWRTPNDNFVWSPLVEMYSDKNKLTLRMEVPGIKKEDIKISVVGNDLIVKGERKAESCSDGRDYMHCEVSYGSFYRSLSLPVEVRKADVRASYTDGILEIDLPKAQKKGNGHVNVKISPAGSKSVKSGTVKRARSRK